MPPNLIADCRDLMAAEEVLHPGVTTSRLSHFAGVAQCSKNNLVVSAEPPEGAAGPVGLAPVHRPTEVDRSNKAFVRVGVDSAPLGHKRAR